VNDLLELEDRGHGYVREYDIRINGNLSRTLATDTPDFHSLIAQIKFIDGMTDGYTPGELQELQFWLKKNGVEKMIAYFRGTILKHRPESKFPHSQLWNLVKEIRY
jgi:hypothetical protein